MGKEIETNETKRLIGFRDTKIRVFTYKSFALLIIIALFGSLLDLISANGIFPKRIWDSVSIQSTQIKHDAGKAFWVMTNTQRFHSGNNPSIGIVLEDGVPLRSGNEAHDVIRTLGKGRYSFWKDGVYFSSSDNTSPLDNGRDYVVLVPYALPINSAKWLYGFTLFGWLFAACFALYSREFSLWVRSEFSNLTKVVDQIPVGRYLAQIGKWVWVNIVPGILVTVVMLLLLSSVGEAYLRIKLPFNPAYWPSKFDEQVGFTFVPGETVNWTNYLDYWTSTKVNSLGFLDREPPSPGDTPNACRVVFIGDSMLEAAQVPIKEKMHVQFEQLANQSPAFGQPIETVAFGFAGSGQVNQIPFYDVFAKPLKPDVVVLIFVNNDFGNNSTTLESIRNGWHPLHPPRLFFEYDEEADVFSTIRIDPDWQGYLLDSPPLVTPNIVGTTLWLSNHSYLFNQLNSRFFINSQRLSSFMSGSPPLSDVYRVRMDEVMKINGYANEFGNWDPAVIGIDNMFLEDNLPPAFEEAVIVTGYALDQFKERSERDGFNLLILTNYGVSTLGGGNTNMFDRITNLAEMRSIPIVDQYAYMVSKGLGYSDVTFPHDAHMSFVGHQTSAEALWEYFNQHPEICD